MIERHPVPPGMRLHPLRAQDLTASDVGAVLGCDPYKSPLRVYAEKAGLVAPEAGNKAMQRGNWLEGGVFEAVKDERPTWRIVRPNLYLRDPDLHLGATPDGIAEDEENPQGIINIQAKVVSARSFERNWQDGPPLNYQLQVATENYLLDAGTGYVAALVLTEFAADLRLFEVPRHDDAEARIRQAAREFWTNIREGRQPAPDYSRDADVIAALHPRVVAAPPLDLSADNRMPDILAEREALKATLEVEKERLDAIDAEIRNKLGTAEVAELPGWRITLKEQSRKEHFVRATTFRKLLVTKKEGEDA
jgi:predicted phage-related endonuclease